MKRIYIYVQHLLHRLLKPTHPSVPATATNNQPPKSRDNPSDITDLMYRIEDYLNDNFHFRYNLLSETAEYRRKDDPTVSFSLVSRRNLNSFVIDARKAGINCWDRDIARYVDSDNIENYHPIREFMHNLPSWDGIDRVLPLARRVSDSPVWLMGFPLWMRGMARQWMGMPSQYANSLAPVLVSLQQGMHKSTFCKLLLPDELQVHYTDSFDLTAQSAAEQKLTLFGLINLDEMDKLSDKKMASLKNLMQMSAINIRKAYKQYYSHLPRMASFIATSNQKELLTDPSGSRRFLCVEVAQIIDCSPVDHRQLYAQLKAELLAGERHWLTPGEEQALAQNNAPFNKRSLAEDVFYSCFRMPLDNEEAELRSAAYIFEVLRRKNSAVMRDVNSRQMARVLISLGFKRIHTEFGNVYRVISIPDSSAETRAVEIAKALKE